MQKAQFSMDLHLSKPVITQKKQEEGVIISISFVQAQIATSEIKQFIFLVI